MQNEPLLREYYAARAKEYDNLYAKPERQNDLRKIEAWLPEALSGRQVLEIACGTGYWTQFYAPKSARVVATDAAEETLALATMRLGCDKVDFRIADAYALSEQLGVFDAAFAGFWLSHVPVKNLRTFLLELHKRLMPGALVIFIDNLYVEGSSTPVSECDADGNNFQMRKLRNRTEYRVLKNFPTEVELNAMIEGVGCDASYNTFEYYWAFSYQTENGL
jgi:demethylmenaquinone methyltransferase/2-methoxy-6-polyprenyl-1,4-benzoquinol methylase